MPTAGDSGLNINDMNHSPLDGKREIEPAAYEIIGQSAASSQRRWTFPDPDINFAPRTARQV
jgi:hypothetical protein